jgi:hypothetical protein
MVYSSVGLFGKLPHDIAAAGSRSSTVKPVAGH